MSHFQKIVFIKLSHFSMSDSNLKLGEKKKKNLLTSLI